MKITRILSSLLLACLSVAQGHALIPTGHKQRLTQHWEFIRQDMASICIKREYAPVTISAYASKRALKTAFISVTQ